MLERLVEVVYPVEILGSILVLLDEDADVDQGENDVADVIRGADPPVLENGPGHRPEALEGEVTHPLVELPARDVARRRQPRDQAGQCGTPEQLSPRGKLR